jgi:hypothetical protein
MADSLAMADSDTDYNAYDYPCFEAEEAIAYTPEDRFDDSNNRSFESFVVSPLISVLTGIPEAATARVKLPKNKMPDITITYAKKPKDRVCTFSNITIAMVLADLSDGQQSCHIKASYNLDSHGERSPGPREPGRMAQTQFALYSGEGNRIAVIPTWPEFWLKCGTNGHLRTLDTVIPPAYFDITEYVFLWVTSGSFYKC